MRVSISNRQTEVRVTVRQLRSQLERALTLLPRPLPRKLNQIDIVLVDRATMAQVHGDFLGDPTETDVITFPYGEILVCPAVARDQARLHAKPREHEVLLYALHGLLHLAGYDDTTPVEFKKISLAQDKLLRLVLAE